MSPPVAIGDMLGNVLLYMPYGYLASSLGNRSAVAIAVIGAIVVSCVTEMTQVFGHGRFPSVQDVLMNVIGATLGIALRRRMPH